MVFPYLVIPTFNAFFFFLFSKFSEVSLQGWSLFPTLVSTPICTKRKLQLPFSFIHWPLPYCESRIMHLQSKHILALKTALSFTTSMSYAAEKQVNPQKGYTHTPCPSNRLWITLYIQIQSHIYSHFSLDFTSSELSLNLILWTKWDFIFKNSMHAMKQISTTYLTEVLQQQYPHFADGENVGRPLQWFFFFIPCHSSFV